MSSEQSRDILLNIESKERRCAFLRNGRLYDLIVERSQERQLAGNIYQGVVTNILRNIQSAFVDINEGDNGFIHISDLISSFQCFEQEYGMDFDLDYDVGELEKSSANADIEQFLKPNQTVLVQVVKEPIGSKGARLTTNLSIPGRYLVLLPRSSHRGVSRKVSDRTTRERLKRFICSFEMPQDMGIICRTASQHAAPEVLIEEAHSLLQTWREVQKKFEEAKEPTLLYAESDLVKKAAITAVDYHYDRILVDDHTTFTLCKSLVKSLNPNHQVRVELYRDTIPMFERFSVEKEIDRALSKRIWLPSGGYLFFERTEAMHTVDVNSGKSSHGDGNVEEALVRINLEAADEIARQLRIRNIGGLIVCDFIDMRHRKSQRRVLERLKERLREDSAKSTILGMSEFGLIEMTRQRQRGTLGQTIHTSCPYCSGEGTIKSLETISIDIERSLKKLVSHHQQYALGLVVHPEVKRYLDEIDTDFLHELAESLNARLEIEEDDNVHLNDFRFYSTVNKQSLAI